MNPLAFTKSARRLLTALAAISGIFLSAGCGSSNSTPPPNPSGFSNSSLNGTYVFSSTGTDSSGAFLTIAGAFTANGSGAVTGGTMDVLDPQVTPPTPVAQPVTGSYNIATDGRGTVTLTASGVGTFSLRFVLTSTAHGLISEFDGNGTGSGTLDLQTSVPSLTSLAGSYAFSLGGIDTNSNPLASAGSFTLNSSGTTTAGVQDFNDNGVPLTNRTLSGSATIGSGTGPGVLTLSSAFGALTFDYYPIDSTHLKLIETDFNQSILSGDAFSQTSASIPSGLVVFTMAGGTGNSGPVANGGLMTSDGTGNFSNGFEDVNVEGTVPPQLLFAGTSASGGSVGGRVIVNLNGFAPATQWVVYPSSGGLLMLETDTVNVTLGAAYPQTATSFAASQGYGLNLTGVNANGPVDNIAQFDAASATANPNMTGILDDNEFATPIGNLTLSGTYTPDSPVTGRGFILVPTINTLNGALGLQYYVVNSSTVLFIDIDPQQVAVGSFGLQNSPSSQAAFHPVTSIVRPAGQSPHGNFKHKK